MISLILMASLAPAFVLLLGAPLILFMKDRVNRKSLSFFILLLALFLNSLLVVYYALYDIIERQFYFNFELGTMILIEILLLMSLIGFLFSKDENVNVENESILDGLVFIILLALIGTIISSNIFAIFSCFIVILLLMGLIFYFGDFPKEFQLLKRYFSMVGISIVLFAFSSLLLFMETETIILTEIKVRNLSLGANILITVSLVLALGLPCGLFPASVFHLKNYYRDSSYSTLYLFAIFIFFNVLLTIRFLSAISLSLIINGFIILILSGIGLTIALIYILTELFSTLDGDTFSLKKLFGYSITADFNLMILLTSLLTYLPSSFYEVYLNIILFSFFMMLLLKSLIFIAYIPIMIETNDDNLKLLGEFWEKYKNYGIIYLIAGLIISFPLNLIGLNFLLNILSSNEITNSLYLTVNSIVIILFLVYLSIHLVFIAISFNQIYFSNEPRYLKKENMSEPTKTHYIPILVLFICIALIIIVFFFIDDVFYNLFNTYFLIIEN